MANQKEKVLVSFISNEGSPLITQKQKRNELCKCGSGKKVKNCCGAETAYYLTGKAAKKRQQEKINENIKKDAF